MKSAWGKSPSQGMKGSPARMDRAKRVRKMSSMAPKKPRRLGRLCWMTNVSFHQVVSENQIKDWQL